MLRSLFEYVRSQDHLTAYSFMLVVFIILDLKCVVGRVGQLGQGIESTKYEARNAKHK